MKTELPIEQRLGIVRLSFRPKVNVLCWLGFHRFRSHPEIPCLLYCARCGGNKTTSYFNRVP